LLIVAPSEINSWCTLLCQLEKYFQWQFLHEGLSFTLRIITGYTNFHCLQKCVGGSYNL
jgi:hypothetical protein